MRKRPFGLTFLAIVLLTVSISFYFQITQMFEMGIWEFDLVWSKLTLLIKFVMLLCGINAVLLLKARHLALTLTPGIILVVAINNLLVGKAGLNYTPDETIVASVAFLFAHVGIILPRSLAALSNQRLHWWKIPKRFEISLPFSLELTKGKIAGKIFDISSTGLYFAPNPQVSKPAIKEWQEFSIRIPITKWFSLRKRCKIVRVSNHPVGKYPIGYGVKFSGVSFFDKIGIQLLRLTHS